MQPLTRATHHCSHRMYGITRNNNNRYSRALKHPLSITIIVPYAVNFSFTPPHKEPRLRSRLHLRTSSSFPTNVKLGNYPRFRAAGSASDSSSRTRKKTRFRRCASPFRASISPSRKPSSRLPILNAHKFAACSLQWTSKPPSSLLALGTRNFLGLSLLLSRHP